MPKRTVLNLTARSETKKGFTMPTLKKIKSALRQRSKTFLIGLIMSMFSKLSKTAKISMLIKIDRKSPRKSPKKASRKRKLSTKRRSTKRKASRKKSKKRKTSKKAKRKKGRTAKQRAATRKLVAFNKRRKR